MLYQKVAVFLLMIQFHILQTISHAIDIQDTKVFEIVLDDANYDEESENEMIQLANLANLKPLAEDESRYSPLHSHVKYYNERNTKNKKQYSDIFLLQPHIKEIFNLGQENKPFIVGFKHNLDKYFSKIMKTTDVTTINIINHINSKNKRDVQNFERLQNYRKDKILKNYRIIANVTTDENVKSVRIKREEIKNHYKTLNKEIDFFEVIRDRKVTTDETEITKYFVKMQETHTQYDLYKYNQETANITENIKTILSQSSISEERYTLADNESSYEESYDYKRFKMEYEQQLEYDIKQGKIFNYTEKEEPKNMPKEALKKIMDLKRPKNCTKEELNQIGIKAIECFLYDYQSMKDITTTKVILSRTWLILRVWLLIYICLAIPCWCQRGWCCCCFRCKFCFPRKRIIFIKQYYAMNPPGIFVKDLKKKKDVKEPVKYKATEYEYNAYKTLETAIRNI